MVFFFWLLFGSDSCCSFFGFVVAFGYWVFWVLFKFLVLMCFLINLFGIIVQFSVASVSNFRLN